MNVSQRIPNFFLGISQQPDNRKIPGQLNDAVNVFPDYALGMLKRPGGKLVSDLYGATTSGKWFSIIRDPVEKYVAQYDNDKFSIWNLLDGSPRAVDMGANTGVPGTCNLVNLKADLATYNTAVTDTATKLNLLHVAQADYAEVLNGQNATTESLFEIQYDYDKPGEIEQTVKSGILLNKSGVYIVKDNDAIVSATTTIPAGYALGTEFTNEYPIIASQSYRVYQAIKTIAATHNAGELATAQSNMDTAQTNYDNAVTAEAAALIDYQAELDLCAIATPDPNGYLTGATAADIELLTLNDYTFVLNKSKVVAMKPTTTASPENVAFVVINVVSPGHYRIYLDGVERGTYNSSTNGDADLIRDNLVADINGQTFGGKTYTAAAVGPGLWISATAAFEISVIGSGGGTSMSVFQDQIKTVAELPVQCRNGYKVKVVNTLDVNADDMYVKFVTDSGGTYGAGVWEETNGWDLQFELDELTLPHQLIRQTDGSFVYTPVTWETRNVGDDVTNPLPSFVGTTINNIFFYRNRLGFLSTESVILSKAGQFFDFFATTALTVTDDDPIDLSASSVKPVSMNYVQPTSIGLVLFSDNEQFVLTTDSDILSPRTSKINELSSYECDPAVQAVGLGVSLVFISKTPLYSRLYELTRISTTEPPVMFDQTQIVPELIPSSIDSMVASPGLSLISCGTVGDSTMYQFRFAQQGQERLATTWYKWDLTGNLLDQFFDVSTLYTVVANGSNVSVQSYDLTQASEAGYLTLPTGEKTDVCLDLWNINPYRTYDDVNDTTRIFLPYDEVTNGTFSVVALGSYIGDSLTLSNQSVGAVLYPTVHGTPGAYYADVDGDYRGRDLLIGYIYTMEIALPKFFATKADERTTVSDFTSDLIIHRVKVATGLSGPVKYQINITGRPEWSNTIEAVKPYEYDLNGVNLSDSDVHTVPIYQRNENLNLKIIGDTPMPVSLLNLMWEGKYNVGFYQRP